jgi:hypothetical protein
VIFWKSALKIENVGRSDWPGGAATLNGRYSAHFGRVRQGSLIILHYEDFRAGDETFTAANETPRELVVAPDGEKPVVHKARLQK